MLHRWLLTAVAALVFVFGGVAGDTCGGDSGCVNLPGSRRSNHTYHFSTDVGARGILVFNLPGELHAAIGVLEAGSVRLYLRPINGVITVGPDLFRALAGAGETTFTLRFVNTTNLQLTVSCSVAGTVVSGTATWSALVGS